MVEHSRDLFHKGRVFLCFCDAELPRKKEFALEGPFTLSLLHRVAALAFATKKDENIGCNA